MPNLLQPLNLLLEKFLLKIGFSKQQTAIITALIILISSGTYYIGNIHGGNSQNTLGINSESNKRPSTNSENYINPQPTVTGELATLFDQKDWDLRTLYKNKEGYYCSSDLKQNYNYAWYKQEKPLLSIFFVKFQTMPSSEISDSETSEVVIKLGSKDKVEYSEFYLPIRIKETVQYKQRDILKEDLVFQTGKELSFPIKLNEPIELISKIEAVEKNHIQTDFRVTYLSSNKGVVLTDPFSYQTFIVDETNPKDLTTQFGFGIDNKSCFKIIKYCFSQICTLDN